MTEDDVRRIVREEFAARDEQSRLAWQATWGQYRSEMLADNQPSPDDGPLRSKIKEIFREAAQ